MELKQMKMESKIGPLYLVASANGLCRVLWEDQKVPFISVSELGTSPTGAILQKTQKQLNEYFEGKRKTFDLKLVLQGSEFQMKVWQQLLKIPYGETRSYKDIAKILKSPQASRAVGTANGKNPISLIVPCHRVINSGGGLGGYAGGLPTKTTLLNLEKVHSK